MSGRARQQNRERRKAERRARHVAELLQRTVAASRAIGAPARTATEIPADWHELECPDCRLPIWVGKIPGKASDAVSAAHAAPACPTFMALRPDHPDSAAYVSRAWVESVARHVAKRVAEGEQPAPTELDGHCHSCKRPIRVHRTGQNKVGASIAHSMPVCEAFLGVVSPETGIEYLERSFGGTWHVHGYGFTFAPGDRSLSVSTTCWSCNAIVAIQLDSHGRPSLQHDMPLCPAMSAIKTVSEAIDYVERCRLTATSVPTATPPLTSPGGTA